MYFTDDIRYESQMTRNDHSDYTKGNEIQK